MILKNINLVISILSFSLWAIDRSTGYISDFIGKIFCQDRYMKAVDGHVGECSCGFNTDMYLSITLLLLFCIGIYRTIKQK